MLPWFQNSTRPLFLAPMAGVTDIVFRHLCKELGADAMVTEFVSAEGIIRQDQRTRKYTEFTDSQRPVGVQLFGADGTRMGEAAKKIVDWKAPDFIDINFGCPVNKVVSKNGGSALLKDCPLLCDTAEKIVKALEPLGVPVTAKIRIGWDSTTINAPHVCKLLEEVGVQTVSVHGRTRAQKYTGEADWDVIGQCAEAVGIPVVGNGDISTGLDVEKRLKETSVSGLMIGRAAMQNPWIFREAKHYLATGEHLPPASIEDRWALIKRHCKMATECNRYGNELQTMQAMRSRLMAYSRGLPNGKRLRSTFATVSSLAHLDDIAAEYLDHLNKTANAA